MARGVSLPIPVSIAAVTWPAGASLSDFTGSVALASNVTLTAGDRVPAGSTLVFSSGATSVASRTPTVMDDAAGDLVQGRIFAVAPLLSSAASSWSISLVSGAALGAANTQAVAAGGSARGGGECDRSESRQHRAERCA